jgi:predicted alpha/beta-fold hydrolase
MKEQQAYCAPWWLPTGHLQTLYAASALNIAPTSYRRERWATPDGDFIDLDWAGEQAHSPLLVLFHGLEGSSRSHYARSLLAAAAQRGWQGVVVHFRGCSGEINALPRAYFAGDSQEIHWVLERIKIRYSGDPTYAVGISLGGNALLKWLGEQGAQAEAIVDAAAAVSVPMDLQATGASLDCGLNRQLYVRFFLQSLKRKALNKLALYPGLYDREAVLKAHTLRRFDDLVTAPLHGFRDTDDYWDQSSSKPLLTRVSVPTLLLNARNDPFMPAWALPHESEVSSHVLRDFPLQGGHVGFVSPPFPGNFEWFNARILRFLMDRY